MPIPTLRNVTRVRVAPEVLTESLSVLRRFGRSGLEGFLLWVGTLDGTTSAISNIVVPPQQSLRSEEGVGYFVSGDDLFRLNQYLLKNRVRLIAQVHSHPTEAYHSAADDRYAIATAAGSFSLVVPNFGAVAPDLGLWAVYRLIDAKWTRLSQMAVAKTFELR